MVIFSYTIFVGLGKFSQEDDWKLKKKKMWIYISNNL